MPFAMEAKCLNHWNPREVTQKRFFETRSEIIVFKGNPFIFKGTKFMECKKASEKQE